ncbi:MAG TPA: rhomboid family intramembrane serine protease [Acidimicrobiales bacterium]|jgi:membrane associated rhomboid family serine protease|nr:rhomboid family intramembrane serine protease [Acidimicrobiales bacterium]
MSTSPTPMQRPDCYRHAGRTSSVVCARCDRPICTDCMIQASVGWQCPECVRQGAKTSRTIRPFASGSMRAAVGTNPTPLVIAIVIINALVFVASGFGKVSVIDRFGEVPFLIHDFHQYYRLFDAMFLHLNFQHILFNMITLVIIGPACEVMLGRVRFVALYLVGGLGGGVLSYLLGPDNAAGVGASGAIFALMGAYVVLARRRGVPLGPVPALIVINLFFDVVGALGNVDWLAHVGGLLVGAGLAFGYDATTRLRSQIQTISLDVASTAGTTAILFLLVVAIAPGHVNIGFG